MSHLMNTLIHNASKEFMDKKSVMEGVIQSALLTPVQREDLDGMIRSAIPASERREKHHSGGHVPVVSVKSSATKADPGMRHFPGSSYA